MRWATAGTILAFDEALRRGEAINMGGGYHHASMSRGEGFCIYADAAIAIRQLTLTGALTATSKILCVDLDAHMGNGFARCVAHDPRVAIFDAYNGTIYPSDPEAREIIDEDIPLCTPASRGPERYRALLEERLPAFLDRYAPRTTENGRPDGLLIYNAGTDVYMHDQLGMFGLDVKDVLWRDQFVITEARRRKLPWAMLTSGGYSAQSYALIAATCAWAIRSSVEWD
jgi:histone deacetylase 11